MTHVGSKGSLSKLVIGVVAGFMVALPAAILVVRAVNAPAAYAAALYKDGFNFDVFRGENYYRSYLKGGAKIDTTQFKTEDGADLKGAIDEQDELVMLLAFDTRCSFCNKAGTQIRKVSKSMSAAGVKYFFVAFSRSEKPSAFYRAAGALGVDVPSFMWTPASRDANFNFNVYTPCHILMARDGTILRVWPGSLDDDEAQERMATQITTDTRAIVDAMKALKSQAVENAAVQASSSRPASNVR